MFITHHRKMLVLSGILLFSGILIGWYIYPYVNSITPTRALQVRENSSRYHFINPLLYTDSEQSSPEFNFIKKKLILLTDSYKADKKATEISVYFRDVNTGRWTGINEDALYEPSSMLKVLVMMAYLRQADTNPSILKEKMAYKAEVDNGQHYQPPYPLASGSYTVTDLIGSMIVNSDNVAVRLLNENNKKGFVELYKAFELPDTPTKKIEDFMSPKAYSTLFRSLYNSTYLSRQMSEEALHLLSITAFDKGLVAGVPKDIVVAHKFGEHTDVTPTGDVVSRQLHDCGIIYYPGNPYFLCVMTKGTDFASLESVIAGISSEVYKAVGTLTR